MRRAALAELALMRFHLPNWGMFYRMPQFAVDQWPAMTKGHAGAILTHWGPAYSFLFQKARHRVLPGVMADFFGYRLGMEI